MKYKLRKFKREHWSSTPAFRDLIAICVIVFEAIVLAEVLELGKTIDEVSQRYASWPIDNLITIPVILSFAFGFYSLQRWKELRHEIVERKRIELALKKRTSELREAKTMAESANLSKSEFLANISHELRTPLHCILSFAGFGIKKHTDAKPEKILDFFENIKQSGETLLELLNDLLDLAKLESGKMTFRFQPTNLDVLLCSIANEFNSLASERNITIRYEQSGLDEKIVLDSEKISQVLRNLLSNAVKFSPDGGVIDLSVCKKEDTARLSVRDQGGS